MVFILKFEFETPVSVITKHIHRLRPLSALLLIQFTNFILFVQLYGNIIKLPKFSNCEWYEGKFNLFTTLDISSTDILNGNG